MKIIVNVFLVLVLLWVSCTKKESTETAEAKLPEQIKEKHLYLDVHNLEPGKVTFDAVAGAHQKDLATQGKYNVSFIKYWVDETKGKVYCLAEAEDSASIYLTHKEAHGLVPDLVSPVTDGPEASISNAQNLYFDVHHLGAGKV